MKILAIANHKGGVGKTTTAVNLAACLAEKEQRVLLVDLDPQGNATSHLGYNPNDFELTINDVLLDTRGSIDINNVIIKRDDGISFIPANLSMSRADLSMSSLIEKDHKLQKSLNKVKHKTDFVIIDCPPSLATLTINAFFAADDVIITIQTQPMALDAVKMIDETLYEIYSSRTDYPIVPYGLPTMHDKLTNVSKTVIDAIEKKFGPQTLPAIHNNVRLKEASGFGKHILEYDPLCSGAMDYRRVAKEIIRIYQDEQKEGRQYLSRSL
ncbi:MAG TPA: ParA family protein [Thermodesulfobacteriota bacterium]|nr:ParA family protein [Thermodesulfobacteriota bacterium]